MHPDLEGLVHRFRRVLIPELNMGQLSLLVRARYLVDAVGLNKVQGQPFKVAEVVKAVEDLLVDDKSTSTPIDVARRAAQ
jgi:2-oxoglutarate ferredoxin oxidoreductase subunit alpha